MGRKRWHKDGGGFCEHCLEEWPCEMSDKHGGSLENTGGIFQYIGDLQRAERTERYEQEMAEKAALMALANEVDMDGMIKDDVHSRYGNTVYLDAEEARIILQLLKDNNLTIPNRKESKV